MKEEIRCPWCGTDPTYVHYHDNEWGVPVLHDKGMFAFFLLETFQAGLSWLTILKRRANFAQAFDNFDYHAIAAYDQKKVDDLMQDTSIIRNKQKIEAAINNAQKTIEIQKEFGSLSYYLWQWVDFKPIQNNLASLEDYKATTPLSDAISADLKKRGFKFVGSTTIYAHMQAAGLVNDHYVSCYRHKEVAELGDKNIKDHLNS